MSASKSFIIEDFHFTIIWLNDYEEALKYKSQITYLKISEKIGILDLSPFINLYSLCSYCRIHKYPQELQRLTLNFLDEDILSLPQGLKYLTIKYNRTISDEGFRYGLPQGLKQLILINCSQISNIQYIPQELTQLTIDACHKISDIGLKNLPSVLENLTLIWCENITDNCLKSLPPNLKQLTIRNCYRISSEGLKSLPPELIIYYKNDILTFY